MGLKIAPWPCRAKLGGQLSPWDLKMAYDLLLRHFYFNIHTRRQIETCESIDGLGCRLDNVHDAFMDSHLELFTRVFKNEG